MSNTRLFPSFGVLIVDDEPSYLRSMRLLLERKGGINHIFTCDDSREVMQILASEPIGVVLLDLTMPHISGQDLLINISEQQPDVAVIVISGLSNVDTAVECLKQGAFDYFVKTSEEARLVEGIKRTIRMQEMRQQNESLGTKILDSQLQQPAVFSDILTQHPTMHAVFRYIESIANSSQPILITGESGTGKGELARACHHCSNKKGKLVVVSMATLNEETFTHALFGHKQGAFAGAAKGRQGLIEQAANGTLFLDDVGDLSIRNQVKLLRLLQDGEYYPLGSDRPKQLKAHIVTATHRDLDQMRGEGLFRKDLYYRLCTHRVKVPPLRSRKSDIPILLDHFLKAAATELKKTVPSYPQELPFLLSNYNFPGNIRELKSLIYDALSRHQSRILSMEVFRQVINPEKKTINHTLSCVTFNPDVSLPSLSDITAQLVEEAMRRANGNQSLAARILGISQPALSKRLKKQQEEGDTK